MAIRLDEQQVSVSEGCALWRADMGYRDSGYGQAVISLAKLRIVG